MTVMITAHPMSSEKDSDVQMAFNEISEKLKSELDELEDIAYCLKERMDIEQEYCRKLERLCRCSSAQRQSPFVLFWETLRNSMQSTLECHVRYMEMLSVQTISTFTSEVSFQVGMTDQIYKDTNTSFDEFSRKKEELSKTLEKYYESESEDKINRLLHELASTKLEPSSELVCRARSSLEKEYRLTFSEFEKRRLVQDSLVGEALKRLAVLEERKYKLLKTTSLNIIEHEGNVLRSNLEKLETCLKNTKEIDIESMQKDENERWKSSIDSCDRIEYNDMEFGSLKNVTFGIHLCDLLDMVKCDVPPILEQAVAQIEARGLNVYQLYIQEVDEQELEPICKAFEKVPLGYFEWEKVDIVKVALMIKRFFDELPEPLFPRIIQESLKTLTQWKQEDIRLGYLTPILQELPTQHLLTLQFLISHLKLVSEHAPSNGMSVEFVSQAFSSCLFHPEPSTHVGDSQQPSPPFTHVILSDLIHNYSIMFEHVLE